MSSEASRPPEFPKSTSNPSVEKTVEQASDISSASTNRPTLMGPPKRPVKPVAPKPTPEPAETAAAKPPTMASPAQAKSPSTPATAGDAAGESLADEAAKPRQQPISPPSEPMQYRAIGLLRGRYIASEEMFNRGQIITQDDTPIGAVLLGRVTSLVKKHLDMESDHLWVVYPRTNPEQGNALNVQIVGVWEPETLGSNEEEDTEGDESTSETDTDTEAVMAEADPTATVDLQEEDGAAAEEKGATPEAATEEKADNIAETTDQASDSAPASDLADPLPTSEEIESDYFSIRGEIAKYYEDRGTILINIMQKVKSGAKQQRPFKLLINGRLEGKTIGYFWDLDVERKADQLVLSKGTQIAAVPPKKKSSSNNRRGGPGGGPRKRFSKGAPPRRAHGSGPHGGDSKPQGDYRSSSRPITKESASETARVDQN